jgi:glycosyltransferase involved in cell wall biosynthesis
MSIVMLSPPPGASGPLPKLVPVLKAELETLGHTVYLRAWGSSPARAGAVAAIADRIADAIGARATLRSHPGSCLLVHSTHDWKSVLRDTLLHALCSGPSRCTVLVMHGSSPERVAKRPGSLFAALSRRLVSRLDSLGVLSMEELHQWRAVAPAARIVLLRNPLPRRLSESAHVPVRSRATVLFVGRLIPEKGILDLLRALALARRRADAELRIAGDGPSKGLARSLAAELELEDRVTWLGLLDEKALDQEYARATLLVLPTYYDEGFPTVILEAARQGLPVVTTRRRGPADVFTGDDDVRFVEPRDIEGIAEAIEGLLGDPVLQDTMARRAMAVLPLFEPHAVAETYERVLIEAREGGAVQ